MLWQCFTSMRNDSLCDRERPIFHWGQTVCGTMVWITELLVNPVKSHIRAQSALSDPTFLHFSIKSAVFSPHTVLVAAFCVALPALYSVNSRLLEEPTATVQSLSSRLHEQLRWHGESSARLLSWARAARCTLAPYYAIRLCLCLSAAWLMDWAQWKQRALRIHLGTWQFFMYRL